MDSLSFNQLSTVLNAIVKQATGQSEAAVVDTSSFVSVANTALKAGYDALATSVSQVLSKTIFSVRPYERKFGGLEVDNIRYGNHVRKLTPVDKDFETDDRITLTDGGSVDQYKVNKPKVLQTNFYGANTYQKSMTIYRDQLDTAFSSPDEFGRFLSMMMQNATDMIEQSHEETARATVVNLIAATINMSGAQKTPQVIKLLSEYNAATGSELTATTVMSPGNYGNFIKWAFSRIKSVSNLLTERSTIYHANVTGSPVSRHSPIRDQKFYLSSKFMNEVSTMVFSSVFNEEYLKTIDYELVNFWQSILAPAAINVTPAQMTTAGAVEKGTAVNKSTVLGVLFDREAAGYTVVNEWSSPTPFNARGGYYNQFWHFTDRYWNDFTENAVVFLME